MIRVALAVSATLAAPTLVAHPPLKTTGAAPSTEYREKLFLSQSGIAGRRVYMEACADCHGEDAEGTAHGPDLMALIMRNSRRTSREFHQIVANGSPAPGSMPAMGYLSFNDVDKIGRYLREVARAEGRKEL